MIIHETLKTLGLDDKQTDIYLALLKLGPASIRDIAETAGINRGTTFEQLKLLKSKGVVSQVPRGKRKMYCPEPPEQLLNLAELQLQAVQQAKDTLQRDIVPDLRHLSRASDETLVKHYEGDDGIEFVLRDILSTVSQLQDRTYRVYSSRRIRNYLYRPFPTFTRQRVQQAISVRVIAIGPGGEDAPLSERKWLPGPEQSPAASYVAVYGQKCAMISLSRGDYPMAVVIESAGIAEAINISFDALWQFL
ncbi:MAG: TrmB family transcriptional regulator [Pseudomonadales bacterium]|jgi:sugar-specific transcriptional regulator TrmB